MKKTEQATPPRAVEQPSRMRKIVVRRTEAIKVTSAPFNHQPLPNP